MLIYDYSDDFIKVGIPKRNQKISRVTIHAAECNTNSGKEMKDWFIGRIKNNHPSSCNYFIDSTGKVYLFVPEDYRAWTSSSSLNDERAITIECATLSKEPYIIYDDTYKSLISLIRDIMERYGKKELQLLSKQEANTVIPDKSSTNLLLTRHNYFADTSCPGTSISNKLPDIVNLCKPVYRVQLGAYFSKQNADRQLSQLQQLGYPDAFVSAGYLS